MRGAVVARLLWEQRVVGSTPTAWILGHWQSGYAGVF